MNKIIIAIALAGISIFSVTHISHNQGHIDRVVNSYGSYDISNNFSDLSKNSSIIVIAKPKKEFYDAKFIKGDEISVIPYAERELVVSHVLKNASDAQIKSGDKINILEASAIFRENGSNNLYTIANYIGMPKRGSPYLIFLNKSSLNGKFSLNGFNLSRIPLNDAYFNDAFYSDKEASNAKSILKEAKNFYKIN